MGFLLNVSLNILAHLKSCSCDPKFLLEYRYFLNTSTAQICSDNNMHIQCFSLEQPSWIRRLWLRFYVWILGCNGQQINGNKVFVYFSSCCTWSASEHTGMFRAWMKLLFESNFLLSTFCIPHSMPQTAIH